MIKICFMNNECNTNKLIVLHPLISQTITWSGLNLNIIFGELNVVLDSYDMHSYQIIGRAW